MKLCMGCMNEIEDHLSICPYCGFNETALRQEAYYLDPGTIIGGKYIVGRVLSYGGHTVSYMGMDAENNRKVIVKEYLPSDFSTRSEGEKEVTIYSGDGQQQFEQGLTNFLNEANRIQHLRNINGIAKVYDCVSENETGYVISEYVEGHTLKEILENGKRYSAEEAANFIRKILQGLVEVHRMDIVHCDISPETIMVTNSGDIKLTDFGATRYVTTANSKSLSIILKRGFAPEEQYRSKGVRGPWTDVYALGAVMYDMITGTVPQESVERALSDDLKEPSKLGISIPKNMENALMNALNVYQKDRTPSAEAFLAELNSREVKRIKVKQQKNKTGKIPVWAKALVAGLACVVVAGGVYIVRNTRNSSTVIATNVIQMEDLTGKTEEEVQEYVEKLQKQGVEVKYAGIKETVFNLDKPDGTVAKQTPEVGTILYDPQQKESNTEETQTGQAQTEQTQTEQAQTEQTQTESMQDDKHVTEVTVTLNSQTKISYKELRDMGNAYAMAKALQIDTKDKEHFIPVKEGGDNYYDLVSLEISDRTIKKEDLVNLENPDERLKYQKENIKIYYYETKFLYWNELPDFKGKNIEDEYQAYRYRNETKRKKAGKRKLSDYMIDQNYYAIEGKYKEGDIVDQNISPKTQYDETNSGEPQLKVKAIKKVFEYEGKKGKEFEEELNKELFGLIKCKYETGDFIEGVPDRDIVDVKVYNAEDTDLENPLDYFEKILNENGEDRHVCFLIIVKDLPQPPTSGTSGLNSDDSGSYSNSSSGYSDSGKHSDSVAGKNDDGDFLPGGHD